MKGFSLFYSACILLIFLSVTSLGQSNNSKNFIINDILVTGNKVTKERVILRELLFEAGDTINTEDLDKLITKTEESLLNTSLFNFVTIKIIAQHDNYIDLFILVEERWYLWPYPILEQADRNLSNFFKDQDWSRINYGMMLVKNNFRGLNETLQLKLRLGYKEQYQIMYAIPYLFKSKKHGLSTEFSYFRQKQIEYTTENDKLLFYRDHDNYVKEFQGFNLNYSYRHKHFTRHHFGIGYYHANVQDTIVKLNNNYFDQGRNETQFIFLQYAFTHDNRDSHNYPLSGYNVSTIIKQSGIGLLQNELQGITSIKAEAYNYHKHSIRWFSGYGFKGKLSSAKKQPFFIEEALGYGDYMRAYEYYVIPGQHFVATRTFVKYAIIPRKVNYIRSWNWTKFNKIHYSVYANVFFESGYVYDVSKPTLNKLPNTLLLSSGIGIDIAAYYDQVFRFEYSINKQGESGFFIHVKKAF